MARVSLSEIVVQDRLGNALSGANVQVDKRNADGSSGGAASIYTSETSGTTLTNPRTTDADGKITGFVDRGAYSCIVSHSAISTYTEIFHAVPGFDDGIDANAILEAPVNYRINNGGLIGTRPQLNVIAGTGISLAAVDDAIDDEVALTITATGGGGGGSSVTGIYDVSQAPYNAVEDAFFTDGVSTASSTTFTSATANFTAADVGKVIVIQKAGSSGQQDRHTTISSVTNSTTVVLANSTGVTGTSKKFYISRSGDQTTAIQTAIDDAAAAGGGIVYCPGVGYAITGLVLKNRVMLIGAGRRATMLHLMPSSNQPVIRNYYDDVDNIAMTCTVADLWIDGARERQSNITANLTAAYTAGDSTLTFASTTNFLPAGNILIGTNLLRYTGKTGTQLTGVKGGIQGTTDANAASGSTVTQFKSSGIYTWSPTTTPAFSDDFDPHIYIENVMVKNCKGWCLESWGQSEGRWDKVYAWYGDRGGFAPNFDHWIINCTAAHNGRMGYYFWGTNLMVVACKAFFSGDVTEADGHGFMLEAPSQPHEGCVQLSSCIAQDNNGNGFYLRNTDRAILASCGADTNSRTTAGSFQGVRMEGTNYSIIDVVCTERGAYGGGQTNSLHVDANCNNNQIRITHGPTGGGTVGNALTGTSNLSGGNSLNVNGAGDSQKQQTFSATITPDPYTASTLFMILTGNVTTINAPVQGHIGTKLRFIFKQDGTGGRTLPTFNAVYKMPAVTNTGNTANKYWVADFEYDGTNWVSTGAPSQWAF